MIDWWLIIDDDGWRMIRMMEDGGWRMRMLDDDGGDDDDEYDDKIADCPAVLGQI